jgi:uncharacterized protein YndB with AHSA1/START domain
MPQFSISTVVQASPTSVWEAITNPDLVQKYFFGTRLDTDWRVGSDLTFRGEYQGQAYEDRGTVLRFEPERGLAFDYWSSFSGTEDVKERRQIVRYDLEPEGSGVRVTVEQSNIDSEERAAHSAKNWQLVLDGLKKLVEEG